MPTIVLGYLAALTTALTSVGWQLATRAGVTTTLTPIDLALIRYVIPALALAPLWLRWGVLPRSVRPGILVLMVMGAGLPFGLVSSIGAQFAPAAHMGTLLPGAIPMFVALLSAALLGETFASGRILGLVLIVGGIAAIGSHSLTLGGDGMWRGDLLFLVSALLWSTYTIAFRKSGMSPWHSASVVSFWSGLAVIPLWLSADAARLTAAPAGDIAFQLLWQGLIAGVAATGCYALAVKYIGPSRAAASIALIPACAALGGYVFLGETVGPITLVGIAAATLGVVFASGAIPIGKRRAPA
jgi:drug/metabolite transporter (DMT)-like permease